MNGRLKRHGNGNSGHRWFRCLNRFSKKTREKRAFFDQMKDEADLEIRRREASKELPPEFLVDFEKGIDDRTR